MEKLIGCNDGYIGGIVHTYPVDDIVEHILEGYNCWCKPEIKEDGWHVIHNSFDGREFFEEQQWKQ